jgi:hypothetical protein
MTSRTKNGSDKLLDSIVDLIDHIRTGSCCNCSRECRATPTSSHFCKCCDGIRLTVSGPTRISKGQ